LFYVAADQKLMAVPVKIGTGFEPGSPQELFGLEPVQVIQGGFGYQPTADGKRFLVTAPARGGAVAANGLTVVLNWQTGLRK
jgi:hypothetical protein